MGVTLLGPTLMAFGSEAQQQRFVPKILSGDELWCQGYSEPGAGSDLANLKTKAELSEDGTHYVVNGSKIWTTMAHIADWIFCLVRSDKDNKYQGITFMLYDMENDPKQFNNPVSYTHLTLPTICSV